MEGDLLVLSDHFELIVKRNDGRDGSVRLLDPAENQNVRKKPNRRLKSGSGTNSGGTRDSEILSRTGTNNIIL